MKEQKLHTVEQFQNLIEKLESTEGTINVREYRSGNQKSKMDNTEELSTRRIKTQHNIYWTPLHANKHK
jgi:hypothetical protein